MLLFSGNSLTDTDTEDLYQMSVHSSDPVKCTNNNYDRNPHNLRIYADRGNME